MDIFFWWVGGGIILPTTQRDRASIDTEEANGVSETDVRDR